MNTISKLISCIFLVSVPSFSYAKDSIPDQLSSENHRAIEYQDINNLVRFINNDVQSQYVALNSRISVTEDGPKLADIKLWMTGKSEEVIDIAIAEDGSIILPELSEDEAEESMLHINQPKGVVSINLNAKVNPPSAQEVNYKDLFIVLEDTNNFMSEMMGGMSMFMPDMDALKFVFEQPATIEIASKRKTYRYETDEENAIVIDKSSRLMRENPKVVFSQLVAAISPED